MTWMIEALHLKLSHYELGAVMIGRVASSWLPQIRPYRRELMKDFNTVLKEGVYRYDIGGQIYRHHRASDTEERAKAIIEATNKAYWDATHTFSAYIIREDKMIKGLTTMANPRARRNTHVGSLEKADLTNVLAMVTRYFGV